jgi:hypothetical protein
MVAISAGRLYIQNREVFCLSAKLLATLRDYTTFQDSAKFWDYRKHFQDPPQSFQERKIPSATLILTSRWASNQTPTR